MTTTHLNFNNGEDALNNLIKITKQGFKILDNKQRDIINELQEMGVFN